MPLNDEQFINDVVNLQDELRQRTDYETAKTEYAQMLLLAIKNYLQSAAIEITGTSNQGAFTGTGTII